MNDAEVRSRALQILSEQSGSHREPEQIKDDNNLIDDLRMDSLDITESFLEAEEEFGVKLPNEEASGCKTAGDFIRICQQEVRKKEADQPATTLRQG